MADPHDLFAAALQAERSTAGGTADDPNGLFAAALQAPPTSTPDVASPPEKMNAAEAFLHGGVEGIPLGQKLTALGSSGALKLIKAFSSKDSPYQNIDDSYEGQLNREREKLGQARDEHKWATLAGQGVGGGASMLALSPLRAAQNASTLAKLGMAAGNGGIYGVLHGAGDGDTNEERLGKALVEGGTNAILGGLGEAVAGPTAKFLGNKIKDLAGGFKWSSLKANPAITEAVEMLPGGTNAAGRRALEEGAGGLTKKATAADMKTAMQETGRSLRKQAQSYDAAGGQALNPQVVLAEGRKAAQELLSDPSTEAAGQQLDHLINAYESKYGSTPLSAEKVFDWKQKLQKLAYRTERTAKLGADSRASDFARGVSKMERQADASLDSALGPEFGDANLAFRQLMYGARAAKTTAARAAKNNTFGLTDVLLGLGGEGIGLATHHPGLGLAAALGGKAAGAWGHQAGARMAYTAGQLLEHAPEAAAQSPLLGPMLRSAIQSGKVNPLDLFTASGEPDPALRQLILADQLANGGNK